MRKRPDFEKKLKGTLRKSKVTKTIALEEVPSIIPPPPKGLSKLAASEWRRVLTFLVNNGTYEETDYSLLHAYCLETDLYFKAQADIDKNGVYVKLENGKGGTYQQLNPQIAIGKSAFANCAKLAAEFGFTPLARSKISLKPKKEANSDMEMLMRLVR